METTYSEKTICSECGLCRTWNSDEKKVQGAEAINKSQLPLHFVIEISAVIFDDAYQTSLMNVLPMTQYCTATVRSIH